MRALEHDDAGLVTNVILLPDDYDPDDEQAYQPPEGLSVVPVPDDSPASSGWTMVDGEPVAPVADPELVPEGGGE